MSVFLLLIPLALLLACVAVCAFLWGVRSGQFDDLATPSHRMLHDDTPVPPQPEQNTRRNGTRPPP